MGGSHVVAELGIRNSNQTPVLPFENDQAGHGIFVLGGGVEELDEDEGVDRAAPAASAVHACCMLGYDMGTQSRLSKLTCAVFLVALFVIL